MWCHKMTTLSDLSELLLSQRENAIFINVSVNQPILNVYYVYNIYI